MDDRLRELSKLGDKQAIIEGIRQSIRSSDLISAKWHLFNAVLFFPKEIKLYTLSYTSDLSMYTELPFFRTDYYVDHTDHSFTDILLNDEFFGYIQRGLYIHFDIFKIDTNINLLDMLSLYEEILQHFVEHRMIPRIGEHPHSENIVYKEIWSPFLRIRDIIDQKLSSADIDPSRRWYYYSSLNNTLKNNEYFYNHPNLGIKIINNLFSFVRMQIMVNNDLRSRIEKLDSTLIYQRILLNKPQLKQAMDWMDTLKDMEKEISDYYDEKVVKKG
jgi:hypothetical protein